MARPAAAQPTNKAGPNSYLQGVGRMPSGVAATQALGVTRGSLAWALAGVGQALGAEMGPHRP